MCFDVFCSTDCALFVCEFIERILRGKQVPKAMDIKLMQLKRATITYQLLSNTNHCWEPEPENVPGETFTDVVIPEEDAGDTVPAKGDDDKASDRGGGGDTVSSIINDAIIFVEKNLDAFDGL